MSESGAHVRQIASLPAVARNDGGIFTRHCEGAVPSQAKETATEAIFRRSFLQIASLPLVARNDEKGTRLARCIQARHYKFIPSVSEGTLK